MSKLDQLRKQRAKLDSEINALEGAARREEAFVTIEKLMREVGITMQELNDHAAAKVGAAKSRRAAQPARKAHAPRKRPRHASAVGVPKFRDPETGRTWTGRGRRPEWIDRAEPIVELRLVPEAA